MGNFDVQKKVEEIQKNMKLMEKELLVKNLDDLKLLMKCRIANEYPVIDTKGHRQWYRHPDLDEFSEEAFEKGQRFFYAKPANEKDPHGKQILCEPEYEYVLKRPLTKEEFDNLFGMCNEKEQSTDKNKEDKEIDREDI